MWSSATEVEIRDISIIAKHRAINRLITLPVVDYAPVALAAVSKSSLVAIKFSLISA